MQQSLVSYGSVSSVAGRRKIDTTSINPRVIHFFKRGTIFSVSEEVKRMEKSHGRRVKTSPTSLCTLHWFMGQATTPQFHGGVLKMTPMETLEDTSVFQTTSSTSVETNYFWSGNKRMTPSWHVTQGWTDERLIILFLIFDIAEVSAGEDGGACLIDLTSAR